MKIEVRKIEGKDDQRILSLEEKKMLHCILVDDKSTVRELSKAAALDPKRAKRIYNKLFAENICSRAVVPNYGLLGFNVMIMQRLTVAKESLPDIQKISKRILSEWKNCVECYETFDGKILVRSVWKDASDFKNARNLLRDRLGSIWLESEDLDMIPLVPEKSLLRIKSLWDDDDVSAV